MAVVCGSALQVGVLSNAAGEQLERDLRSPVDKEGLFNAWGVIK